jgi:hypothetical protein
MVRVQFSHAFDRGEEFWIILEDQPAPIRAVAGFCSASFEGGRKGGAKCDHLLDFWVELAQRRPQQRQSL